MADNRDEWILQTVEDCENYINEVGFLPLFASEEFPGGSVQERTKPWVWWTGNEKTDPWLWREQIAAKGTIAYGKFFHGRAGFVSREWFPYLANYRRAGYDYDSRWDEGLATNRSRKIMSLFMEENADKELFSFEVKRMAGFGKEGEKNFEGTITDLQMQTYLIFSCFETLGFSTAISFVVTVCHSVWRFNAVPPSKAIHPVGSAEGPKPVGVVVLAASSASYGTSATRR